MAEDLISKALRGQTFEPMGPLETFGKSALWSVPGWVGVEPPPDVQRGQAQNPTAGFLGGALGYMAPYVGWAKVAGKIPALAKAVEAAEATKKVSPFLGAARTELTRFAPLEAMRLTGGTLGGESLAELLGTEFRGPEDVALNVLGDLVLGGAVAGTLGKLGSAGKAVKRAGARPGANLTAAPQIQIRQLRKTLAEGKAANPQEVEEIIKGLEREIRAGEVPQGGRYVFDLGEGGSRGAKRRKGMSHDINRLFRSRNTQGLDVKRFAVTANRPTFRQGEDMVGVLDRAGLRGNYEWVSHPRFVVPKTEQAAGDVASSIKRNLHLVDGPQQIYMRPDAGDGLYVMARRVDDGWAMWKTDSPGIWLPQHRRFAKKIQAQAKAYGLPKGMKPLGQGGHSPTAVYDVVAQMNNELPAFDMQGVKLSTSKAAEGTKKLADAMGITKALDNEGFRRLGVFVKDDLTPAMFQFPDNSLARKGWMLAKTAKDTAEGVAERLFFGGKVLAGKQSLWGEIMAGGQKLGGNSLDDLASAVAKDKGEWGKFAKVWREEIPIPVAKETLDLSDETVRLLEVLKQNDDFVTEGILKVKSATGDREIFAPREWHYGISRRYKGDNRVEVLEGKRVVGYGSGKSAREAEEEALKIIQNAGDEGRAWKLGKSHLAGEFESEVSLLRRLNEVDARDFGRLQQRVRGVKAPPKTTTEKRGDMRGFIGDETPFTLQEFKELVLRQYTDYQNYIARMSANAALDPIKDKLVAEGAGEVAERLARRVDAIFGVQGKFSKIQNQAMDKILGPHLGKNSASKIAGGINKWASRWTFGFFNGAYNMANLLTFAQTAFPQMAFLANAAPTTVGKYYTHFPVFGQKTVGGMGMLDITKVTAQSFREMGRPSPELRKAFERAAAEGVWAPKFLEEYIGKNSSTVKNWKGALQGDEPFVNLLGAVADFVPTKVEEFSRGHSFTMGYVFFRDILQVADEELLYKLAKEFTEKSMFMYQAGDKAQIINGPIGSLAGWTKNWLMHYISWMGIYADEGFTRNNWKPLLWMTGSTTALGGVAATPAWMLAETAAGWMGNDSLMQSLYEQTGGTERDGVHVADMLYHGLPAGLGFTLQNQLTMPFTEPSRDAGYLFSFAQMDRAKYAAKWMGQAIDYANATGNAPVTDAPTRELFMRAFAPKTLYRVMQAMQDESLRSLSTGYPIADLSPLERLGYGLGVDPRWVATQYKVSRELWDKREAKLEATKAAGLAWAEAVEAGDYRELRDITLRAVYQGLDVSSIIKSAQARGEQNREDLVWRNSSPEALLGYMKAGMIGR